MSLNNQTIKLAVNIIRNTNITSTPDGYGSVQNHKVAVRTHALLNVKSAMLNELRNFFVIFQENYWIAIARPMISWKSFTFVMSKIQCNKKKILALKFNMINFSSHFSQTLRMKTVAQ